MVVASGMMLSVVNVSIVNIALPAMAADLGVDIPTISWVVTGFLVTQATLLAVAGRAGDLYGRRRVFVTGVIVLFGASILCALAWNAPSLTAFRVLQAMGACAMAPTAYAYAAELFGPRERGAALGVMGGVLGMAPVLALNIAGVLVGSFGWRSVFWFSPVMGALVLAGAFLVLVELRPPDADRDFDLLGAALAAVGLFPLLVALSRGEAWGWTSPATLAVGLRGRGGLALFVWHESRASSPMIDLRLLRRRSSATANLAAMASSAALFGTLILLPFYLTAVLGFSAVKLALGITPVAASFMIVAPIAGRWIGRVGSERLATGRPGRGLGRRGVDGAGVPVAELWGDPARPDLLRLRPRRVDRAHHGHRHPRRALGPAGRRLGPAQHQPLHRRRPGRRPPRRDPARLPVHRARSLPRPGGPVGAGPGGRGLPHRAPGGGRLPAGRRGAASRMPRLGSHEPASSPLRRPSTPRWPGERAPDRGLPGPRARHAGPHRAGGGARLRLGLVLRLAAALPRPVRHPRPGGRSHDAHRAGRGGGGAGPATPAATSAALRTLSALAPGRVRAAVGAGFTGRFTLGVGPVPLARLEREVLDLRGLLAGEERRHPDGRPPDRGHAGARRRGRRRGAAVRLVPRRAGPGAGAPPGRRGNDRHLLSGRPRAPAGGDRARPAPGRARRGRGGGRGRAARLPAPARGGGPGGGGGLPRLRRAALAARGARSRAAVAGRGLRRRGVGGPPARAPPPDPAPRPPGGAHAPRGRGDRDGRERRAASPSRARRPTCAARAEALAADGVTELAIQPGGDVPSELRAAWRGPSRGPNLSGVDRAALTSCSPNGASRPTAPARPSRPSARAPAAGTRSPSCRPRCGAARRRAALLGAHPGGPGGVARRDRQVGSAGPRRRGGGGGPDRPRGRPAHDLRLQPGRLRAGVQVLRHRRHGPGRDLTPAEILDQAVLAAAEAASQGARLTNAVFMGMGEPLQTLDAVLEACAAINSPDGLGLSARKIAISTVGWVPGSPGWPRTPCPCGWRCRCTRPTTGPAAR